MNPPSPPNGPPKGPPNSPWAGRVQWGEANAPQAQVDPYRAPPPEPPQPPAHPALDEKPWRVSTLTRTLGAQLFVGCFGALVLGAFIHGGDPHQKGGGSAADALFSPIAMLLALGVGAVVLVFNYMNAGALEGAATWIRRVKPAPPMQIGMHEIVHVSRTRGLKIRNQYGNVREARTMSFKITAADGRTIAIPEAAVFRQPKLLQFYDGAMKNAFLSVGDKLAQGVPLVSGAFQLFHDRLVWSGGQIGIRDLAMVQVVIGESAKVTAYDRAGRPVATLPDDELMLRALIALGVRVDEKRAAR